MVVVFLSLVAAVACNNDSDPTDTAIPAATNGTESVGIPMLQLPSNADTVERVRPAVVSIVAQIIVQDRFGPQ